ncbi:NAD-dependent epimerase/dehydratase family protein [Acidithiobacillus sp. CV18-2]|uniref:NAD-dependent epimerase/dehydratase family protein n=1 Tax=Igneacidithiobacillus copahuensis TaxID=2724909 RepID=A0AAE3CKN4_9PROT|nr:hopanoid-associated sugar epimerase [Igneacidithiobacillus copahuensis]MBU2754846.1 NAD-dependent epimerase/dehydratase family protein [Acidithiobacillus sp. CV18-3]MBU2756756.1 NAD-dependent epimerase/dehydratase family protein [Acidithiobacillus sp. BN09-2]MBU2777139.1 NAD-dependent epimerase/dehydratase family protein [Acidithiobacillus sp. CV18-2]MBU2795627.1 NAD-dependent epimerase/dehydratase family protein [Acidithiobacillus sp. VAN18-2]MBU2799042.1 NAD-dependent epimerase/dehydratas
MRALITGASGFVGAAVLRRLTLEGVPVRVLARAGADDSAWKTLPDVERVEGDLCDPASLQRAVAGCRWVFHVAADYRLWVPDPEPMYQANVAGTEALLRAALDAGVERIVYTSSVAVLGLRDDGQASDEDTPSTLADMIGHYKRSKFLAEERVRALCREEGAPIVIVNPSTPIGPEDRKPTPTGRMVLEAAAGRMPAYVDTGLNVVHVDDVALGHWLALQQGKPGERYILGGDNLSLQAILTRISGLTGRPSPRLRLPRRLLYPIAWGSEAWVRWRGRGLPLVSTDELRMAAHRMYFDSRKAEQQLGYTHRPAEEALRDAVAWFAEHRYF